MIKSIKIALDNAATLNVAAKKTYKKPDWNNQPDNYIYFLSHPKVAIKTGFRQRFSFYIISKQMETIESLGTALYDLLVWNGNNIDPRLWKVMQITENDFPDEMIRVIDFTFYYTFT